VLERGWRAVPEWAFCSQVGTATQERNFERVWFRVRRKAQKQGVRPLRLHCTRHTFASLALASGKSPLWVAAQLGHRDPGFTLRVYGHAMREEEQDLSFADFARPGVAQGRYASPADARHKAGGSDAVANPPNMVGEAPPAAPPPRGVSRRLDQRDKELAMKQAQMSLESARTGQSGDWHNPSSGNSGTFTPTRTYQQPNGLWCREYTQEIVVGGERKQSYGTACRNRDGTWTVQ